jgi:hypothetical protein
VSGEEQVDGGRGQKTGEQNKAAGESSDTSGSIVSHLSKLFPRWFLVAACLSLGSLLLRGMLKEEQAVRDKVTKNDYRTRKVCSALEKAVENIRSLRGSMQEFSCIVAEGSFVGGDCMHVEKLRQRYYFEPKIAEINLEFCDEH